MTHEKVIKREDGSRIEIVIIVFGRKNDVISWECIVFKVNEYDKYKKFSEVNSIIKNIVTPEEIYTAKLEAWEKLKPSK